MPPVNKRTLREALSAACDKSDVRMRIGFSEGDSGDFVTERDFTYRFSQKGKAREEILKEAEQSVRELVSTTMELRAITYVRLHFLGVADDTGTQETGVVPSWQVPIGYFTGQTGQKYHTETAKTMSELSELGQSIGLKGEALGRFVESGVKITKPEETPTLALTKELQSAVRMYAENNRKLIDANGDITQKLLTQTDKFTSYLEKRNADLETRNRTLEADKKGSLEGTLLAAGDLISKMGPAGQATIMAALNAGLDVLSPESKQKANEAFTTCLTPVKEQVDTEKEAG